MHLKPLLTLEDCLPYPLPASQTLIQHNKGLLYLRVLDYKERELEKMIALGQTNDDVPDHLLLLPFNPAITMRKRPHNEQLKLNTSSFDKKVRRHS